MKVCQTCRHWSYTHKGFCARINTGVGRFWMCEDWAVAEMQEPGKAKPGTAGPRSH